MYFARIEISSVVSGASVLYFSASACAPPSVEIRSATSAFSAFRCPTYRKAENLAPGRTLATVITQTKNRQAALDNPQEFALQTARIIREKTIQQLVDGIQYFKDGTWYDLTEWVEKEETVSDRLIPVDNSIYDYIVVQSDPEKRFVEKLKKRTDIRLFVKLPGWFKVPTPLGQYNPDWGLVMEEVDAFGDAGPLLYLVRETKSTKVADQLRGTENQKIHCGERHFVGALGVNYRVITSADDLP